MEVKPYKRDFDYSYTLGAFPSIELLKTRPELVEEVIVHSSFTDMDTIGRLTKENNIPVNINDKVINRLSDKENVFVIAVFRKYEDKLEKNSPHVVLVNPGNMGNVGTIMRSAVAFGIKNMAIIEPGVDIFNPKAVRASMGAEFRMNVKYFHDFKDYEKCFPEHEKYCFMLNAKEQLSINDFNHGKLYSLVFGNEATGLSDEFLKVGKSIIIPQSDEVDSLNITIAAGVGMFVFTR